MKTENNYIVDEIFRLGHNLTTLYFGNDIVYLNLDLVHINELINEKNIDNMVDINDTSITHKAILTAKKYDLTLLKDYYAYGNGYFETLDNLRNYLKELILEYDVNNVNV